jgi:predicted permease
MSPRAITLGLRRLLHRRAADRDLNDEIAQYLSAAADEYVRAGLTPAQAERQARLDFGGVEAAKDAVREAGWESILEAMRRDLSFGLRTLWRNPAFTAVAVLTLALGTGATTAMFSVINAVILRPLPYRDPDQLALIWTDDIRRSLHQEPTAFRTIEDWRQHSRVFQSIAFFNVGRNTITENGQRDRTRSVFASSNLFSVLGAQAALGRTLSAIDDGKAAPAAVISHALWQRRFNGDSGVLGKSIVLEGAPKGGAVLTIVGVMPASFYFPDAATEIWMPAPSYWRFDRESSERFLGFARRWTGIGRVRAGSTIDDARMDMSRINAFLTATYIPGNPDFPGFRTNVVPILDSVAATSLRSALWVLMGGVILVLMVACANVANLLLARGASRGHEFAVRKALGARRGRLVAQLMSESLLLAAIGGIAGVALAWAIVRVIVASGSAQVPRLSETTVDGRVLLFALIVAVVAGLVFGAAPAWGVSSTGSGNRVVGRRSRGTLVVIECALAIVLLAGAGLLLRSLDRLRSVDPGFNASNVLAARVEFPPDPLLPPQPRERGSMEKKLAARRHALATDLARRIAGIPGVARVGYVDDLFLGGVGNESIAIPGRAELTLSAGELSEGALSSGFFETLEVPLKQGRYLTEADVATKIDALWAQIHTEGSLTEREARAVFEPVVVNEEFVRRFFPADNPIGKHFCIDPTNKTYWYTIVGVVGDMRRQGLAKQAIAQYFGPWFPPPMGRADLLVRTSGDPLAIANAVRREINATVPGAIIASVSTVDEQLGAFEAQRDFQALLLAMFATLGITLAAVGVYGVVHYAVNERTRELGVRIALGATPTRIRGMVLREGMRGPMLGIGIGVVAALATTRVLSAALFGITAADPATYVVVALLLLSVAAAACFVPAVRATKVDPITALRRE